MDIAGPLLLSNGCFYLLACVDQSTRWPKAIPLPVIATPMVVKAFLSCWVAIFGEPSTVTTDRGCTLIRTTVYHPTANGTVERFHRQLKTTLRAADDPKDWTDHLPLVLLGLPSALRPGPDCSAAGLVLGATVKPPGRMITPNSHGAVEDPTNLLHRLRQFMWTLPPVLPRPSASPSYPEKDFVTCAHVQLRCNRVRRPFESLYDGPFRALSRGTKTFRIRRASRGEVVSVGRPKASVPDFPSDETCGLLSSASPPPPASIPPLRIWPFSPVYYLHLLPLNPTDWPIPSRRKMFHDARLSCFYLPVRHS
nr:unnamed protein product [Spirometra erinaceieuropaei]